MIDIETYKTLHGNSEVAKRATRGVPAISAQRMANDDPPAGDVIYLFPPDIIGYELRRKKWGM